MLSGCAYTAKALFTSSVKCVEYLQGEDQKKLDILANEVFSNMLAKSGQCAALVSTFVQQIVKHECQWCS